MSFAAINLCVVSQLIFVVVVVLVDDFVIDSVRKLLDTLSYHLQILCGTFCYCWFVSLW
jgi:hypothetical protein